MQVCIFEDTYFTNLLPLAYTRPVYDLRLGCMTLREKLLNVLPSRNRILQTRPHLTAVTQEIHQDSLVNTFPDDNVWFINGRIIADTNLKTWIRKYDGSEKIFCTGNEVVAAFVRRDNLKTIVEHLRQSPADEKLFDAFPTQNVSAKLIRYPWELVSFAGEEIEKDFLRLKTSSKRTQKSVNIYKGVHILNKKNVILGSKVTIKPGAVLDAEKGPIVIGDGVTIMPNAFIEGPAYIGKNSIIKAGASIYHGTSIGEWCKVGGEVHNSIIHSYSNKQHEGFLGHSYIGSWVNIGANTNTSDLKNTYGTVKVKVNGQLINSGLQFVGVMIGDHSKTGINMMFETGSVVGVSCNLYGASLPPKFVPSFSWGSTKSLVRYDIEKSLEVARRMMSRRGIQMSNAYEAMMRKIFFLTKEERKRAKVL